MQAKADGSAVVQRLQKVIQRIKYVRIGPPETGTVRQVDDAHKLNKSRNPRLKEYASDETEYIEYLSRLRAAGNLEADHAFYARAEERFGEKEGERNRTAIAEIVPKQHEGKQMHAPRIIGVSPEGKAQVGSLIFRGMSPNNIKNFEASQHGGEGAPPVFIAENPTGRASAKDHIADDDRQSPYLSFEAGGVAISAGKYALKPVSKNNTLVDVSYEGGHLKSNTPSYRARGTSRNEHHRAGMVAGVSATDDLHPEDYSTETTAKKLRDDDAQAKAIADKEILIRAGTKGIAAEDVPFIALVEQVDEEYYRANASNQTPSQALGYYKPNGPLDRTVYYRLYIPTEYAENFGFDIAAHQQRHPEDLRPEMGAIDPLHAPPPARRPAAAAAPVRNGGAEDRRRDTRTVARPALTSAWDTALPGTSAAASSSGGADTRGTAGGKMEEVD
ncbi:hypothetical protein [uncultured Roseobacter sp.]|uniref:hypothetical protein n=1 Tax=uncultured Roseobacter sp. TaxID=114847 RepID=UPI002628A669|nr:hypothetical protein [uncultured Roseobacter sp.]